MTAAAAVPPGPAAQQGRPPVPGVITGSGYVGSRGGRARGSPPPQSSAPSPAAPLTGPPAAGRRPGPASRICAGRSAATPQAQIPRSGSSHSPLQSGRRRGEAGPGRERDARHRRREGAAPAGRSGAARARGGGLRGHARAREAGRAEGARGSPGTPRTPGPCEQHDGGRMLFYFLFFCYLFSLCCCCYLLTFFFVTFLPFCGNICSHPRTGAASLPARAEHT